MSCMAEHKQRGEGNNRLSISSIINSLPISYLDFVYFNADHPSNLHPFLSKYFFSLLGFFVKKEEKSFFFVINLFTHKSFYST